MSIAEAAGTGKASSAVPATAPSSDRTPVRRGFKFRITADGGMLLLVVILIGFAAWHSGTNLLYLIFALLVSIYLLHGFMLSLNLSWLTVSEVLPDSVTARQPFDITVSLSNRKRFFPASAIRVSHMADNSKTPLGHLLFTSVAPRSSSDGYYQVAFPQRGVHTLSHVAIATRYPFGFEERTQFRIVNKEILVYPPTYNVSSVAAEIPTGLGDQESITRGTGTELYGLREYIPGEHARHVHWRTSIRAQKIMVAEFFREERRQVMLVLDSGVSPELHKTIFPEFENAVILTASLARHLIDAGYEVGLLTANSKLIYGQGSSQIMAILRRLALLDLTSPATLAVPANTAVEIIFSQKDSEKRTVSWPVIDSTGWRPPRAQTLTDAGQP